MPEGEVASAVTAPTIPPKKKGCGCFLWGCFGTLGILFLFIFGGSISFWYGMKNFAVPDTVVLWTYEQVIRPKIEENLPPNYSAAEKERVLKTADFGVKRYLELPPGKKKALFKEALIATYYYSNQQVIPPEKIPNLRVFIEETVKSYKQGP